MPPQTRVSSRRSVQRVRSVPNERSQPWNNTLLVNHPQSDALIYLMRPYADLAINRETQRIRLENELRNTYAMTRIEQYREAAWLDDSSDEIFLRLSVAETRLLIDNLASEMEMIELVYIDYLGGIVILKSNDEEVTARLKTLIRQRLPLLANKSMNSRTFDHIRNRRGRPHQYRRQNRLLLGRDRQDRERMIRLAAYNRL